VGDFDGAAAVIFAILLALILVSYLTFSEADDRARRAWLEANRCEVVSDRGPTYECATGAVIVWRDVPRLEASR
jgi:hypothetical protein